jgi:hypothetical protein
MESIWRSIFTLRLLRGGSTFSHCAVHWLIRSQEYPILVFLKAIDITEAWNLSFVLERVIEFVSRF